MINKDRIRSGDVTVRILDHKGPSEVKHWLDWDANAELSNWPGIPPENQLRRMNIVNQETEEESIIGLPERAYQELTRVIMISALIRDQARKARKFKLNRMKFDRMTKL